MTKTFQIDAQGIRDMNMAELAPSTWWHPNAIFFERDMGQEHYRLLAYLSSQCKEGTVVVDIGTYVGFSALALAHNSGVHVVSYDLENHFQTKATTAKSRYNITFKLADCTTEAEKGVLKEAAIVLLDVDPHDGVQEPNIFAALERAGFRGILVLDDIHLNAGMRGFWNGIPSKYKKYDISAFGHHSGTGLVVFDETAYDVAITN